MNKFRLPPRRINLERRILVLHLAPKVALVPE
jgi:hypothetical protein